MRGACRALFCLALATGCGAGVRSPEGMPRNRQGWLVQDLQFRKAVDLVLVLDDGPTMQPKQRAFERGFHALLETFFSPWHNIDLQVAQVSSRAGGRDSPEQPCTARELQLSYLHTPSSDPLDWRCTPANQRLGSGGHRIGPGAVRACLGSFGHSGCGRNEALGHVQHALRSSLASWVRKDAVLALLFLSDDRDCSLQDATVLAPDAIDRAKGSQDLSEQCFSLGATCEGERDGAYAQCEIRDAGPAPRLLLSEQVIDDLFALKDHRYDQVIAAAISGVSDQEESQLGYPLPLGSDKKAPGLGCVQWSMTHAVLRQRSRAAGEQERWLGAQAPIRLRALAEQTTTPQERALYSICVDDLRRSLHEIANQIVARVRPVCVFDALLDRHPQDKARTPHCELTERGAQGEQLLAECARGTDGAYLVDPSGQGLARPEGADRCVAYRADRRGDQSADPYDDMSPRCRDQQARVEVELHGDLAPGSVEGMTWTLRCARAAPQ